MQQPCHLFVIWFYYLDLESVSAVLIPGCNANSNFGCCSDGLTPATGPNQQGCPGKTYLLLITKFKFSGIFLSITAPGIFLLNK